MGLTSPTHLIIVVAIILLLFGARRIPELARSLGRGMREFQRGVSGADERPDETEPGETGPDKIR